jgi:hypothetical protein
MVVLGRAAKGKENPDEKPENHESTKVESTKSVTPKSQFGFFRVFVFRAFVILWLSCFRAFVLL